MSKVELMCDAEFDAGVKLDMKMNTTPYFLTTRYQPIVELASDVTIGFEVLSKIESEQCVNPETFFMKLDNAAFIDVVRQQIEGINRFYDEQVPGCNVRFFINIRLSWLHSPEFAYLVSHIAKCRLSLEIDFMDAMSFADENVMESITMLLDCGHEIWLDDYDGGEFNQLVEAMPWSGIKIDKTFLWKYAMDYKKLGAVLSSTLLTGRKTIIEGVETYQQRESCRQAGFMSGQGFYWREYNC
jgi:EAL domain-containing protein (putative c-di-GMP-specific phosphodiesterase class I)